MNGQWASQRSNPASTSTSSHVHNPSNSNNAGLCKVSLLGSAGYTSSHHNIGSRPYGANTSILPTNSIGTGYDGYYGYTGYSGYNMSSLKMGMMNSSHQMNSKLPDNMNLFGPSGSVANGSFMKQPFPRTNFDDGMYGQFNDALDDRIAHQLDYIINDPRKTNDEIKALIENIRPDEDLPVENREGTPEGLKYPLVGSNFTFVFNGANIG